MRGVFVGDLHLEKMESLFPEHVTSPLKVLDSIQQYCMDNQITRVFQGGDICDNPYPRQSTINAFIKQITKYPKLQHYIILGNHDFSSTEANSLETAELFSKLTKVDNLHIFFKPTVGKIDGVPCYFCPYPFVKRTKRSYLCFGHFELKGAKSDYGIKLRKGVDPHDLGDKNFWMLGHLHSMQTMSRALYVGSILQNTFGESETKYFADFEAEVSGSRVKVDYQLQRIDQPYLLKTVTIACPEDLKGCDEDNTWYRIFINSSVSLPDNWLLDHPRVLKPSSYTTDSERKQLAENKLDIMFKAARKTSPTYGLKTFMASRGMEDQGDRAVDIVNAAIAKLRERRAKS